jgi:predicted outer membrane protein
MRYCKHAAAAALMTVLLAGCATQAPRTGSNRPPVIAPTMPVVAQPMLSPEAYFAQVSSLHLYVVKASDQIAAREGSSGVGLAALRLAEDHRGIAAQLSMTGRRLNMLPSATLMPRHEAMLGELQGSGEPSVVFVRQMKSLLPRAYAIHQRFAGGGSSPTLRPVAVMAAPIIARDYQLIKDY